MDWGTLLPLIAAAGAILALLLHWRSRSLHAKLRHAQKQLREREGLLRQSEARLEEFLGALQESPNGVILLDERARIEWCNQTAASHFGLEAERDRGQYIGNLVRDPAFAAYMTSWNYSRDVVLSVPGPGAAPLKLAVQLHAYAGHRRLLLSRDITAAELAETMRRDFVANVSHEIRTPLTVLSGFVETLQSLELPPPERERYLGLMAQQAQRMQTLVSDLLTLSRLEGSPWPGTGDWLPAAGFTAQCEQEARSLSAMLGRKQEIDVGEAPAIDISGAPAELQSALSNLVSNAVRYTPAGGRVEVRWQLLPDGRLQFSVRDTGPGIAPEHIPRLTERFYRVDRSRSRETGGTGLGLAIVKHVVQRHGAELRIDSTPGEGSTFTILFPAGRVRRSVTPDGTSEPRARESAAG
jgi:two-component system phosphate regulon sensor histidine kinase PhoR